MPARTSTCVQSALSRSLAHVLIPRRFALACCPQICTPAAHRVDATGDDAAMRMLWQRRLAAAGGVASAGDLHAMGLSDVDIRLFAGYGSLIRVRRGWYASPDADPLVVEACRFGGRLACVSALAFRGELVNHAGRLHIELPANAIVRVPDDQRARVRMHWARHPSPGDRAAVGVEAARRQALACGA